MRLWLTRIMGALGWREWFEVRTMIIEFNGSWTTDSLWAASCDAEDRVEQIEEKHGEALAARVVPRWVWAKPVNREKVEKLEMFELFP